MTKNIGRRNFAPAFSVAIDSILKNYREVYMRN